MKCLSIVLHSLVLYVNGSKCFKSC